MTRNKDRSSIASSPATCCSGSAAARGGLSTVRMLISARSLEAVICAFRSCSGDRPLGSTIIWPRHLSPAASSAARPDDGGVPRNLPGDLPTSRPLSPHTDNRGGPQGAQTRPSSTARPSRRRANFRLDRISPPNQSAGDDFRTAPRSRVGPDRAPQEVLVRDMLANRTVRPQPPRTGFFWTILSYAVAVRSRRSLPLALTALKLTGLRIRWGFSEGRRGLAHDNEEFRS